jgi:hypothetical protein
VVEDVVQDVQNMQAAALRRWYTARLGLQSGGILLAAKRLGEGDQVLAKRGDPRG